MRLARAYLLALVCASAGCAKAPFTTAVLERFGLTARELDRVQFFTSDPIVLERETTRQLRVQEGAELSFRDDTQTEVVEISEHTPCVVLRAEGDYLLLGFSPKDVHAALWFSAQPAEDAQAGAADRRYVLVALENGYEDTTSPFTPQWSKGFLVSWSGEKYHVASGRNAYLLYELKDDFERRKVERSPPGWRVTDRAPRRAAEAAPTNEPAEP